MPLYEYLCKNCKHKVMFYLPTFSQTLLHCPHCNSNMLQRLFSTFSVHKTDKGIYEDILNDSQLTGGMLNNDPRALAEWNKRMSRGEKVAPEYEEMVEKMEHGEMPPNLAGRSIQDSAEETD